MNKKEMKTPISDAFREWEKTATIEEKEKACDDGNALATVLKERCHRKEF